MNPSGFRVLLDQGLPRDTANELRTTFVDCSHVGEIGMSAASDTEILEYTAENGFLVATLDADFHAMLVVTGRSSPSVIRIRLEGLKGTAIAAIISTSTFRFCAKQAEKA